MNDIVKKEDDKPNALALLLADPEKLEAIDADKLGKLLSMHEKLQAEAARKSFFSDFRQLQAELEPIRKKGRIDHFGGATFAKAEDIIAEVSPKLNAHGFSWSVSQDPSQKEDHTVFVLTLRHDDGHTETHRMDAPIDYAAGNRAKTKIQSHASSYTYCERQLLIKVLGLQLTDDDDGSMLNAMEKITESQALQLQDFIDEVNADRARFLKFFKIDKLEDMPANRYKEAVQMLEGKLKKNKVA